MRTSPANRTFLSALRQRTGLVLASAKRNALRLRDDCSGLGAVEFALLAPLLLMLYISAFEVTQGFSASKRTARAAGVIADLVSQEEEVTPTTLSGMTVIANSIFAPMSTSQMSIVISGIAVDSTGKSTVSWSWTQDNSNPYKVGSTVNIPSDMAGPSSFLIRSEVTYPYKILSFMPGLLPSQTQDLTLYRQYYFRQRTGDTLPCTGCATK
ncbi:MAG: pilus assembly protein [Proteobacteria bacterium]|nr:pilus assembly protein [Pseudomonadota bacterium]